MRSWRLTTTGLCVSSNTGVEEPEAPMEEIQKAAYIIKNYTERGRGSCEGGQKNIEREKLDNASDKSTGGNKLTPMRGPTSSQKI